MLFPLACAKKDSADPAPSSGSAADDPRQLVVAHVGQTKITVGRLEEELAKQNPYVRMRYNSPERKKEFLKNLVRFEVLAQEARRRKLQKDPEVIRRTKRVMIDRLMEDLQSSLVKMSDITDQEIEEYYQSNTKLYHQPPKVRASQIVCESKAKADKVLALAKKKPADVRYFSELVQQYSIDEESKKRQGDLNFFAQDATTRPPAITAAAFALGSMWQLGGPIKTEQGWVVLMKTGEIAAVNRPLDLERDRIKNRLYNEKRIKTIEQYIEQLHEKAKVTIEEANLAQVKVRASPPRPPSLTPPQGPPPGRHPGAAEPQPTGR